MTRSRLTLAIGALALLAVLAGCNAFGPGNVNEERAARTADYDWDTTADVTVTIDGDQYRAVYDLTNRSTVEVYRFHRFNNKRPIDPVGVQFRYPNGMVVDHTAMSFEKTRTRTIVTLPAREGKFAYTGPAPGKRLRFPVVVEGSYEVILPEGARVRYFLLGRVLPSGSDRTIEDGRVHLRWDSVTADRIVVRYYLVRDLLLFSGLVTVGLVALVGGLVYFWMQLRALRERREQVGLDVASGDDDS